MFRQTVKCDFLHSPIGRWHARGLLVLPKIQGNFKDNLLFMTDRLPNAAYAAQMHHRALSRWDNEGGATLGGHREDMSSASAQSEVPALTNSELMQLRVRVIALENLVICLLAQSFDRQLDLVHEMAAYISPRPGFTPHHLTIRAAAEMMHMAERARHFRDVPP